jgi:hypothetical protein
MIPVISCLPRFLRCAGLVITAFASLCVSVCAYAAEPPIEVSGGVFVEVSPDGQLKFSTEGDNPIPLRDGRFAIHQDGHWSIERFPRDNPTEVKPLDFAVSWKQYLNHRVLLRSISVSSAKVSQVYAKLPGFDLITVENAEDQPEILKHLIEYCGSWSSGSEAACKVDISAVVEKGKYEKNTPRLVDGVFTRTKP